MISTINLKDKLIIFICCLINHVFQKELYVSVLIMLIAIIVSGLLSYFDDPRVKVALIAGFIVASYFVTPLVFFAPLLAYDLVASKYPSVSLFSIAPLLKFMTVTSPQTISLVISMIILSILIRFRADDRQNLHSKYYELKDETTEMSIQLTKQNRDLVEKQDNELNLATLNERNRIAREIHDSVGHLLSRAILQSGALLTINKDDKVKEELKGLNDTLSQAMDSIRISVHQLYDESFDLNGQMESIISEFSFCEISYEYSMDSNPDRKVKYAFIAIVKEALSNMMKHSNATYASISFREHPALYQLVIRDNGQVTDYTIGDGLGLKNMKDRVKALNGHFTIITKNGFELFISIPKEGIGN